jgi:hypothetical protein
MSDGPTWAESATYTALMLRELADRIEQGESVEKDGTWAPTPSLDTWFTSKKQRRAFDAGRRYANVNAAFALRCTAWINEHGVSM